MTHPHPRPQTWLPMTLCLLAGGAQAAVNDVFPGDYTPLPAGLTVGTGYFYHREYEGPYLRGRRLTEDRMVSQVTAARLVRYGQWGNTPVAALVVLPYSENHVDGDALRAALGTASASGLADVRVGATAWLYNRPEHKHYLALSAIVFAPSGTYSGTRTLNPGENRWKGTLSLGWSRAFSERWVVDLSPELGWYGTNDDYAVGRRQEQAMTAALTGYARYRIQPGLELFAGGQWNRGGETTLNGVPQRNAQHSERAMLGLTWSPTRMSQIILRYSRDTGSQNGLRLSDELALRGSFAF